MLNTKLIESIKPYREMNFNDEMNLINIFQDLSLEFPNDLPLVKQDIHSAIMQRLAELGFNTSSLAQSEKYLIDKNNPYQWPLYHSQIIFKNGTYDKGKIDYIFHSVTFDKKMMMIGLNVSYVEETLPKVTEEDTDTDPEYVKLLLPIDDKLLNLFILSKLCDQQNHLLNNELVKVAAKLIYVQQSSISVKVNDTKKLKNVEHDFGEITNAFLEAFRIPENINGEFTPDLRITDLIKYMYDVLNDKPVDSGLFNLITQGSQDSSNITINQARQLHLDNVLSEADKATVTKIKEKLSPYVAKKVKHVWIVNNQKSNKTYGKHVKHVMAVHGTQNLSVLNILGEGLLDSHTLEQNGSKHYHYTGSGLGTGIYFARMDQADKSYNYTESQDGISNYMFVADVVYEKVIHTSSYNPSVGQGQNVDLVWGDAVGSYDRDEIVAKHPEQVQIKYLLELE